MKFDEVREHFPIFKKLDAEKVVYLDNASTTQKPYEVINAVMDFYENHCSNVHRGVYRLGEEATEMFNQSRENIGKFIGAKDREIVFLRNTTEALNLLAHSLGSRLKEGDEIILSNSEHHSNIVPWQMLKERKKVRLKFINSRHDQPITPEDLSPLISGNTKIVSLTECSNILGNINDIKPISKIAHDAGAVIIVDGAQSVPHMPVNVKEMDCDFLAFSGHKMLGPSGIGCLYGKEESLEDLPPFMGGGEMIRTVTKENFTCEDIPIKFEAGTPNIEGAIGFSAAIDFLRNLGMSNVRNHEKDLISYTLKKEEESNIRDLISYGTRNIEKRAGIYAFNIGEIPKFDKENISSENISVKVHAIHPHDLSSMADKTYGVELRSGHHCAMPMTEDLGVSATTRASYYVYNTREDVEKLFEAISASIKRFGF